jgi:hypothetical protein
MEAHGQFHVPPALIPVDITPVAEWVRDWVGHRAGVDAVGKKEKLLPLPGIEPICLDSPATGLVVIPTGSRMFPN